jgi:hypothetical protein
MPHPLSPVLRSLHANVEHLLRHAITADTAIRRAVADHDGWPSTTSIGRERGNAELTSVEAAADRRVTLVDTRSLQLRQLIEQAETITGRLVGIVNDWLPHPERGSALRCSGGGALPGALDWGRPDCTNIATRQGLCDACYMRMRRWTSEHDPRPPRAA